MIRTLRIIISALLVGLVVFLVVAAVIVAGDSGEVMDPGVTVLVLLLLLAAGLGIRVLVPSILVGRARRKIAAARWVVPSGPGADDLSALVERTGDAGRLMVVYQQRTIMAAAPLEMTAFVGGVVSMMTHSVLGLAVVFAMIVLVAMHFPTRSGMIHWIETQLDLVERERTLRST